MIGIGESRVQGRMVEDQRNMEVSSNVQQVKEWQLRAEELEVSLSDFMGGRSLIHSGGGKIHYAEALNKLGVAFIQPWGSLAKSIIIPGVDYKSLLSNPNRVKYYCSFKEGVSLKDETDFIASLVAGAKDKNISMQLKNQDHNYDGLIIYTWHDGMSALLRDVYASYNNLFQAVPRIFHGELSANSMGSIGWVQEPLALGYANRYLASDMGAHSDRMSELGKKIGAAEITIELFEDLCKKVGVKADKPYLISPDCLNSGL